MTTTTPIKAGSDMREQFRRAYDNRYTWDPDFSGYRGRCIWQQGDQQVEGRFEIGANLKAKVEGIEDEEILKAINSQLWEVAIHRVRTPSQRATPMTWELKCLWEAREKETATGSRAMW